MRSGTAHSQAAESHAGKAPEGGEYGMSKAETREPGRGVCRDPGSYQARCSNHLAGSPMTIHQRTVIHHCCRLLTETTEHRSNAQGWPSPPGTQAPGHWLPWRAHPIPSARFHPNPHAENVLCSADMPIVGRGEAETPEQERLRPGQVSRRNIVLRAQYRAADGRVRGPCALFM